LPAAGCDTVTTQEPVDSSVITPVVGFTEQAVLVVVYVNPCPDVELAVIATVPPLLYTALAGADAVIVSASAVT